jgi:hypothetical protein
VARGFAADSSVLVVDQQLGERVTLDRIGVLDGVLRRSRTGRIVVEPQLALARRPVAKPGAAVRGRQRGVQRIAIQPCCMLGAKLLQPRAQLRPTRQRGIPGIEHRRLRIVRAAMLRRTTGHRQHRAREHRVVDQPGEPAP